MSYGTTKYTDPGLGNFVGDFANPKTPLWQSANTPSPGGGGPNTAVSTLAVNASGGIMMDATGTLPNATYAPITFNRAGGAASQLVMNVSNNVPTKGINTDYLTVAKNNKWHTTI